MKTLLPGKVVILVVLAAFSSGCSSMKWSAARIDQEADVALETLSGRHL